MRYLKEVDGRMNKEYKSFKWEEAALAELGGRPLYSLLFFFWSQLVTCDAVIILLYMAPFTDTRSRNGCLA